MMHSASNAPDNRGRTRAPLLMLAIATAALLAGQAFGQCPSQSQAATPVTPSSTTFSPGSPVAFTWLPSTALLVNGYEVIVTSVSTQQSLTACTATITGVVTCTLATGFSEGSYSWVVRSHHPNCTPGLDSTISKSFTVSQSCPKPGAFSLANPPDQSVFSAVPTLFWNASAGADHYLVHIGLTNPPTPLATDPNVSTTSYTPQASLPPGKYYWYVDSVPACGEASKLSSDKVFSFTIVTCPSAPVLVSPAGGSTVPSGQVTFNWTAPATGTISGYNVHLDINGVESSANTTSPTYTTTIAAGRSVEWAVGALAAGCSENISAVSSFSTQSNCTTATPSLTAPASGAVLDPSVPVAFSWNGVAGASGYDVMLASGTSTNYAPAVSTQGQSSTTASKSLSVGSYSWYVRASFSGGCPSTSSSISKFVVASCPTAAPVPVSPADGSTVTSGAVTLSWVAATNALSYEVFAGLNGAAATTSLGSTTGTSLKIANVDPGTSVSWFVRASAQACTSLDSKTVHFTTAAPQCGTAVPTLVSPASGATNVTLPVTFSWTGVSGATGYNVYLSSSANATPSLVGSTTIATTLITSSVPAGQVVWYVQALFATCPPVVSASSGFTAVGSPNCPTQIPVLKSPADGAQNVTSPIEFSWSDAGADFYRVLVSVNGSAFTQIGFTKDNELTTPLPSGNVEWYVETYSLVCPPLQSQHARFTIPAASICPTNAGAAKLLSPADGATGVASPVTFSWSPVTGAKSYHVIAAINDGTPDDFGEVQGTQLTVQLPQGKVTWEVESVFGGDCPSTVSSRSTFTVSSGTSCNGNQTANLIAPANGASGVASPVTFQWSAVTGASGYKLVISVNGGSSEVVAETTETSAVRIVPDGSILWGVIAEFPGCPEVMSAGFRFTTASATVCPGGTVKLNAPADGATVSSPVAFSWSAVTGASTYRLWISIDGGAAVNIAKGNSTALTQSLPSGSADWYVEAVMPNCPSVVSPRGHFTISKSNTCDSNRPVVLTAPAEGAANVSPVVDFAWNATNGAIAYRVWISVNGGALQDLGLTTDAHLHHEVGPGSIEWFVETLFGGCPSLASAHGHFRIPRPECSALAPTLIAPPSGAQNVGSPVTLIWSDIPNAEEYRVFGSLDGTNFVLLGETESASLIVNPPPGTITWFVESEVEGCPATRSPKATFTVPRSAQCGNTAADLLAPANGSASTANAIDFVWNRVSNSVNYVLWVKHENGTPTAIARTPDTHVQQLVPDGEIEWWVETFFSGCPSISSAHSMFSVSTPCEHGHPLPLTPPDGAANLIAPVFFSWTPVPDAIGYKLWAGVDDNGPSDLATTSATSVLTNVPAGTIHWFVQALFANCQPQPSSLSSFSVLKTPPPCAKPGKPQASVVGQVQAGVSYTVRWTPVPNAGVYELQESTAPTFVSPTTQTISGLTATFSHTAGDKPTPFFYRVRATSNCADDRGPYSDIIGVLVIPDVTTAGPGSSQVATSAEIGTQGTVVQKLFLPGFASPINFSATTDKPWLTVSPSSGTLPTQGLTLALTAAPGSLPLGTNTATVIVTYSAAGKGGAGNAVTPPATVPVSISLVTPVTPGGTAAPPPDSLIIAAVAHATGANNSTFESDVRVSNISAQTMKYLLNFTATGTDGTLNGKSTTIEVSPGQTTALDDILASFFGTGSDGAAGVLEIRPLTSATSTLSASSSATSVQTVASSRTYNTTPNGTFGQFIPAIPFAQFVGRGPSAVQPNILSLQQIAQSDAYRTNLGLVEAAGEPADLLVSVFDNTNQKLADIPISLQPGEHKQINSFLQVNGLSVADGRIEVQVTSNTGKITAYASVIDNLTNDPLLVSAVLKGAAPGNRFVLPGVADLNTGLASWRTDMRIFNAGTVATTATLSYYPQGAPDAPQQVSIALAAGEVKAIDNTLQSLFGLTNSGGSIAITTTDSANVIATARTYNQTSNGTYGQFIPAVTPASSVANGGRALQILQLEQSNRFRTNIGLAETSGNPATVEVSVILPDSKVTPKVQIPLAANEFRQFSLADFGLGTVYNARVTVKVISGPGRATAYGSVIDMQTQDPTYVPAQ